MKLYVIGFDTAESDGWTKDERRAHIVDCDKCIELRPGQCLDVSRGSVIRLSDGGYRVRDTLYGGKIIVADWLAS